jgi:hypothetical protein
VTSDAPAGQSGAEPARSARSAQLSHRRGSSLVGCPRAGRLIAAAHSTEPRTLDPDLHGDPASSKTQPCAAVNTDTTAFMR